MKHSLFLIICFLFLLQLSASANENQVGDVIGQVYPVDIVTYFNNDPIPAYNTGGETAVLVADLGSYGFDVYFEDGVAYANYNYQKQVTPIDNAADTDLSVLYSDIIVKINNIEVPAYNVDGHMAVPMERMCEVYAQTNKENEVSPYSVNYIWDNIDRKLYLELSDDVVFYQDFMIQLLQAAKMDFDSPFYNDFVKQDKVENPNAPYLEKFTDIAGTKLETYIHLLDMADLIDADTYENGSKLHPYRAVTRTDAAFLLSRILGSGIEAEQFFDDPSYPSNDIQWPVGGYDSRRSYIDATNTTYTKQNLDTYDWYKTPEWIRPYFVYLSNIDVMTPDENNYICPNEFLTASSSQTLIDIAIAYMTRGIIDFDITLTSVEEPGIYGDSMFKDEHPLQTPAQIINNILYIPLASIVSPTNNSFTKVIENTNYTIYCNKEGSFKYYNGETNWFTAGSPFTVRHYSVFDAFYIYTEQHSLKLLYGELMIPVFDYTSKTQLKPVRPIRSIFNPNTNILNVLDIFNSFSS